MEVEAYKVAKQQDDVNVVMVVDKGYDNEEEVGLQFEHENNKESDEFIVSINGNGNLDSTTSTSCSPHQHLLTNNVYFNQLNGMWQCRHCDWNYCVDNLRTHHLNPNPHSFPFHSKGAENSNGISEIMHNDVTLSASETNTNNVDDRNVEAKKNLVDEMNQKSTENLNRERSSLTFLEKSSEQKCGTSKPFDDDIEADDLDILEEIVPEYTEFDVERVIQKQNTHDLYCPNCNSCITRKVILRRRKLKTRNGRRKPKHNKSERNFHSEVEAKSTGTSNDLGLADGNTSAENSQALGNNDHGREREADVFRCLSCFSLFIPTGNGFKLFRFFRDDGEKKSTQNPENEHVSNTNWLFSMFAKDKRSTSAEQGTANDIGTLSRDGGYQVLNASIEEHKYSENASIDMGSTNENTKASAGVDAVHDDIKYNSKKINLPSSDDKLHQNENGNLTMSKNGTILDAAPFAGNGSPMSLPQQIGVSSSVSSTFESLSQMKSGNKVYESLSNVNLEKNSSVLVQNEQALQNGQTSFIQDTTLDADMQLKGESMNDPFDLTQETPAIEKETTCVEVKALDVGEQQSTGNDVIVNVGMEFVEHSSSQNAQDINVPLLAESLPQVSEQRGSGVAIDVLKSIVYGGLIESITSLGVVSSAAGAGTATLNILALGLANLIGGLFIIAHHLVDLKGDGSIGSSNQANVEEDRYFEVLGRRQKFSLHTVVVILSYIIFALLPPVIYGFSFRKSDDKDAKLAVVGASSLVCIILLAAGKAHVQRRRRSYLRTILYFVSLGIAASGASYVVGDLLAKLLEKEGLFNSSSSLSLLFPEAKSSKTAWTSY